jgi:8-oxo-dGTP pyrophosphatase MutT (NUDIX family)
VAKVNRGKPSYGRTRGPVENAVSAGGVVARIADNGLEIVICGRDADGVWGLPKGTPNEGETMEETAVREVTEETGLEVEILDKVGIVEYWFARSGTRFHKWVHYFLMKATGGDPANHDLEYDRVEWRPVDDAMETLTFKNEIEMVVKVREMVESSGGRGSF